MRKFSLIIATFFLFGLAKGQKIYTDTICIKDTVVIKGTLIYPKNQQLRDTTNSFLATYCDYKKNFGLRFDFAFSQYLYSKSMADWIGDHQGTNLNLILAYKKLNVGVRFKPWTTNTRTVLTFNNKVLPKDAEINPFKIDYFVGYEFDLSDKVSIEPSFGYTMCTFKVINEDKIKEQFAFNTTNGLLCGLTINKYILFDNYKYIVLFGRINHGFVKYSDIHPNIQGGYTEICLGLSYKFYWRNRIFKVIKK